jgi:hypothetical protein
METPRLVAVAGGGCKGGWIDDIYKVCVVVENSTRRA